MSRTSTARRCDRLGSSFTLQASPILTVALLSVLAACAGDSTVSPPPTAEASTGALQHRWSDPATWPSGAAPGSRATVVIPRGQTVLLDVSPPNLASLVVEGQLIFDDRDIALSADQILVRGTLQVGTAARPFRHRAVITLTGAPAGSAESPRVLGVTAGGVLDLHGAPRLAWTRLAGTALPGATTLTLGRDTDWRPGDRIVVASSDFDQRQAEELTVASVSGPSVTVTQPLRFQHWGELQTIAGREVDERAEVALLTRNIVIQGEPSADQTGVGGHVMVMAGGTARIAGVELYRMGQSGQMGRYAMHWHLADRVPGQYIRDASIHRTFNRCLTVHGTHELTVERNVCYDHEGHGFFLEDGVETANVFRDNLALVSRAGSVIPSDDRPSSFWITNPDNVFENNVSAGSAAFGFWIAPPKHPTGLSATSAVWPYHTPLRRFDGNVVHSSAGDGVHIEADARDFGSLATDYRPRAGGLPTGAPVNAVYSRLVAYKNAGRGFWARGDHQVVEHSLFANNNVAVQIGDADLRSDSRVSGTMIIGETRNVTQHGLWSRAVGFLLYDGPVQLDGVTFVNFPTRLANASWAITPAPGFDGRMSPRYAARGLRFVDAAQMRHADGSTLVQDGERLAILRDDDGSLTGTAGSTVVPEEPFLLDASCAARPDWRAHVCTSRFAAVRLVDGDAVAPARVRRDDGLESRFNGYTPTNLSLNVPTRRSYEIRPDAGARTTFGVEVEALATGDWVTAAIDVGGDGVSVSRVGAVWEPVPMVGSRDELARQSETAGFHDRAAGLLVLRFVGVDADARQTVAVRPR